ncbi:unnamed protein product [Ixodes pacificus]
MELSSHRASFTVEPRRAASCFKKLLEHENNQNSSSRRPACGGRPSRTSLGRRVSPSRL